MTSILTAYLLKALRMNIPSQWKLGATNGAYHRFKDQFYYWPSSNLVSTSKIRGVRDAKGSSKTASISEYLDKAKTFLINLLTIGLVGMIIYHFVSEFKSNNIILEPLEVCEELTKTGISSHVITGKFADQLTLILTKAQNREARKFAGQLDIPEIEIPGAGMSVRALDNFLRRELGISQDRISGELYKVGSVVYLTVRVNDSVFTDTIKNINKIDYILYKAAKATTLYTQPYTLAAYQMGTHESYAQCKQTIAHCLASSDKATQYRAYVMQADLLDYHLDDNLGDTSMVNKYYKKAIALMPSEPKAYINYGISCYNRHQFKKAEVLYKKAEEKLPLFGGDKHVWHAYHLAYGATLATQGKKDLAEEEFKAAIESDVSDVDAYTNYGILLISQGSFVQAKERFNDALDLGHHQVETYYAYGQALGTAKKYGEAIKQLTNGLAIDSTSSAMKIMRDKYESLLYADAPGRR